MYKIGVAGFNFPNSMSHRFITDDCICINFKNHFNKVFVVPLYVCKIKNNLRNKFINGEVNAKKNPIENLRLLTTKKVLKRRKSRCYCLP